MRVVEIKELRLTLVGLTEKYPFDFEDIKKIKFVICDTVIILYITMYKFSVFVKGSSPSRMIFTNNSCGLPLNNH